jgi:hypothetical protein
MLLEFVKVDFPSLSEGDVKQFFVLAKAIQGFILWLF